MALSAAACGGEVIEPTLEPTLEPTAGSRVLTPTLAGPAVEATVGRAGGELVGAGPGGVSFRLTIPPGALSTGTEISMTPIAAIDGLSLSGGLLGGVELKPDGLTLLQPAALEIQLDEAPRRRLEDAATRGEGVIGFSFKEGGAQFAVDLVETAPDLSVVILRLFGFSVHAAAPGTEQDLGNLGRPADPSGRAQYDLQQILLESGTSLDPSDPANRAAFLPIFRDWFNDAVLPAVQNAADPPAFEQAMAGVFEWYEVARLLGMMSKPWFAPGDALEVEGLLLKGAALLTYEKLFDAANAACNQSGDMSSLRRLIELDEVGTLLGLIDSRIDAITAPGRFCVKIRVARIDAPAELEEGATGTVSFAIDSDRPGVTLTAQDLAALRVTATFKAAQPTAMSLSVPSASVDGITSRLEVDATALTAISGSTAEGAIDIEVRMLQLDPVHASATVPIDVVKPGPITCGGPPVTVRALHSAGGDVTDHIYVRFDESKSCSVVAAATDQPDIILVVDTDSNELEWDAEATGSLWTEESGYGKNLTTGTKKVTATSTSTGRSYTITLTVTISLIDGGPNTRMTVSDVTITAVT